MCRLSVGGIKGETWADIELNFMPSPGFIWKGPGLIGHNSQLNL